VTSSSSPNKVGSCPPLVTPKKKVKEATRPVYSRFQDVTDFQDFKDFKVLEGI